MNYIEVCQLDSEGYFTGVTEAYESPLEPGVYALPFGAVNISPPKNVRGKRAKLVGGKWKMEALPIATEIESTSDSSDVIEKRLIQQYLDKIASDYGYYDIASAISYADEYAVPKFQTEGKNFRKWRSLVWEWYYSLTEAKKSVPNWIKGIPKFESGE